MRNRLAGGAPRWKCSAPHPCLVFKTLAAGRVCDRKESVEQAFRETFQGIKPTDAVIVGIYDRYADQPGEDAALTSRYGAGPRLARGAMISR